MAAGFGVAVFVRIWSVFPFQFIGTAPDWALLVRVMLGLGILGATVGLFTRCVSLVAQALRLWSDRLGR